MHGTGRRRFLAATASTLALAGGCLAPSAARHPVTAPVGSWPSFRGDRHNTGFARGARAVSSDPSVAWTFEADGPFWGSPVVADGTLYVGNANRSVYAIDAESGTERWAFETGHRVEGTPAYADGTVYVGSYDQHVYAIDAETGEPRWEREVGGLVRGSPTVVDDAVLIGVGCHNLACSWYADEADVAERGWIYSLDTETGGRNWRLEASDEVVSTPATDGETAYVGSSDGTMYALGVADGDVKWTYDAGEMIWSSPAVAFETAYFGDWGGTVHAVDATSGQAEWTVDTGADYISGSAAVDEEAVYVGTTPRNFLDDPGVNYAEVFRLGRRTGTERWRFETNTPEIGSSPVVTDDWLYVNTHRPSEHEGAGVHALSTDGEERWFLEVGGRGVGSSPALVDGVLYVAGTDGRVYALE